jgi:hypothetical protein
LPPFPRQTALSSEGGQQRRLPKGGTTMKSDIRTFVLPAGAVVSKRPMNPEEFSAMNCYEQLQELSYLYLEGVGDNFESDFLLANMRIEGDPDAQHDYSNRDSETGLESFLNCLADEVRKDLG